MGAAVQRSYSLEEVEAGLSALAIWHGNGRQAARVLKEQGLEIPERTLYDWRKTHADRLAELQEQIVPKVREKLAQQFEVIGMRSAELTLKSLEKYDDKLDGLEARDLAGAIRNISTTGAIGVDKASLLRGLPTEIRQTDSAEDILKRLAQKHPGMFVEGTAEEIREAEVVSESPNGVAERQLSRAHTQANAPAQDASDPAS